MPPTEIAILSTVTNHVDHAIREGHKDGLAGLREVERELVTALSAVHPDHQTDKDYRAAMETLEDLRRAIAAELLLEGTEEPDLREVVEI
ncbi:MAG: hypothetical protein ABIV06_02475 [Thermoanaerobaculia bacterium]